MNVMGPLLLKLLLQGVLLYDALAWSVSMPSELHGLQGSCLVIPCSFYYTSYPPENPSRVVWYQWVSRGYPLVYDSWYPNDVIWKFRWQTNLYGDPSSRDCSLLITRLDLSHRGEKLYAWIDPEHVGWRTYKFYDVTSTIIVDTQPRQPSIYIYGGERTGDRVTVACSTFHSCPYSKPTFTLKGVEGSDEIKDESFKDGLWKITLTRTGVIKAERSTIECLVTHHGGITVTATKDKSAECAHQRITIEPELADVTEGVAKNFICNVHHSCQKENPTITWNYENMQITNGNKKLSGLDKITFSNITFLGSKEDNEKKLSCKAKFSGADFGASVVLRVQQYQKPANPVQNETYFQYVADVLPKITALPRSCVVIPCSFKMEEEYVTRLRVLWVTKKGGYMFHTDPVDVLDNFKGRTRLLGNPDEHDCTVEIDNVQTHDNGPFCFRAERENERYSFNNSCVFIIMRASPDKPVMSSLPEDIEPGTRVTVKCSVNHTCSSHPPQIIWSIPTARETVSHNHMGGGVWETVSAVTFVPTGYEEKDEIVCTANFWGGKTQENTAFLSIRRVQRVGFEPYIIASSLVFILICALGGVFIYKRRHKQPPQDMQGSLTQSKPRRSVWNRFSSRFSIPEGRAPWNNWGNRSDTRYTEDVPGRQPRPEQRRSIWSRFSRHQSPRTNTNLRAEYKENNICTVSGNKPFSKPHMPSPKRCGLKVLAVVSYPVFVAVL
ncbi:Schwann cell myelin protein-like [Garra rufa]|uniref:Schwann cell myelin protein-like n=1 Tax=Garra rufa TaxID=137080 RepID=UPI003CCEA81A